MLKPLRKYAPNDWKFSADYYKKIAKASVENCDNFIEFNVSDLGGHPGPLFLSFEEWLDSEKLRDYLRWGFKKYATCLLNQPARCCLAH